MVIPFSRSRSIESRTWLVIWRGSMVCVASRRRSARVDLPWSMCATMLKLRMRSGGIIGPKLPSADAPRPGAARAPSMGRAWLGSLGGRVDHRTARAAWPAPDRTDGATAAAVVDRAHHPHQRRDLLLQDHRAGDGK